MLAQGARAIRAVAAAAGLAAMVAAGLTGCAAAAAPAASPIQIGTSYMPVPVSAGTTVAYVVIRNNGGADRLLSARTSAGGQVAFRAPDGHGSPLVMHTVGSIAIPAHSTFAMVPDGYHLLITGAGPIHGGRDVTLTLVFAHAGAVPVVVQVTNPATGGSSYFLN
ncbi:MAG TPA: copper chaperone PCu(A)C [Streptosporangiaceae bacterium]|nr:copper chaperone PCu(A)C [Streptosporangiaceae bacterium]